MFLAVKSDQATEADRPVITDLLDTLRANLDRCVGMAANMIGVRKRITTSGTIVTNPGSVYSEPKITLTGSGNITLMVGTTIVELTDITGSIVIDSALQEAYIGNTLMNDHMSGDFPVLKPGQNAISWSGNVTRVVVRPNWRYL